MNERHPYERHLAEKLQNLPPPGEVDPSWEQMRLLLDKEMPRGGAMPGRRRWWFFMIAAGVLFLGTWLSGRQHFDKQESAGVAHAAPASGAAAGKRPTAGNSLTPAPPSGEVSTGQLPPVAEASRPQGAADAANSPAPGKGEPPSAPAEDPASINNKAPALTAANTKARSGNSDGRSGSISAITGKNNSRNNKTYSHQPNADEAIITRNDRTQHNRDQRIPPPANTAAKHITVIDQPDLQYAAILGLEQLTVPSGPVPVPATSLDKDYARKIAGLPAPAAKAARRVQHTAQAGTFALGFSLPLAFPLGDQKAMGYNAWAGHNTASDYIPSPHLQYHVSDKTYFQTEAQFVSPQFIPTTLLSKSTRNMNNYTVTNLVYAKKLYYFNLPVSVHHSPFPGFYMGTGIQFSSMLSGVALNEERKWVPGSGELITETYSRFRNDSLTAKMNTNEFRILLDANYYFNKFTVGLRYNQALTNYISSQLMPNTPYTFEKNRALQFYLRYNLWEEKRRAAVSKKMLTLK